MGKENIVEENNTLDENKQDNNEEATDQDNNSDDNSNNTEQVEMVNIGGRDIPFEEAKNLFERELSSSRQTESIFGNIEAEQYYQTLKKNNIDENDIALLNSIKNGDKNTILFLLKQSGINIDELDEDTMKSIREPELDNVLISKDEIEISRIYNAIGESNFNKILSSFDDKSKDILFGKDKEITLELANDMESGLFDKVIKEIRLDKKLKKVPSYVPDIELYYGKATEIVKDEQKKQSKTKRSSKNTNIKEQVKATKSTSTSSGGSTNKSNGGVKNYLKMKSDKDFLEAFNKDMGLWCFDCIFAIFIFYINIVKI